ncbi:MAG: hypothetical protein OD918_08985, partial [Gammaproteobacteria bacterium]
RREPADIAGGASPLILPMARVRRYCRWRESADIADGASLLILPVARAERENTATTQNTGGSRAREFKRKFAE